MQHVSVLLHEVLEGLSFRSGEIFLDGTLGGGGHSEAVCSLGVGVKIIALDQDTDALERSRERLEKLACEVTFVHENFRHLGSVLENLGIKKVDKILLDLGLSSNQLEESGRGFTFLRDEPLLMTFGKDESRGPTAQEIVNEWNEERLAEILKTYGEERFAKSIARGIVERRERNPITTTFELVEIIKRSFPRGYRFGRIHVATKTFQALRVAVNEEMETLTEGLIVGLESLKPNGRIAVISFHSLEDRIVKRMFREWAKDEKGIVITKKPITPKEEEVKANPRSRSAKLRIFEKT